MGPQPFSRGNPVGGYWYPVGLRASMGPQPFSRGNVLGSGEIVEDGDASMGPQPFSRGNQQRSVNAEIVMRLASMGPQPFSRGNGATSGMTVPFVGGFNGAATFQSRKPLLSVQEPDRDIASMGPQPFSRGNANVTPLPDAPEDPLQWGRNLSVAETRRSG